MTSLNGILPVDKRIGPTSHDVVAIARRALGIRRIGHTGTLDPFASGFLLLCLGASTRLAEYLTVMPKSYEATLRLGISTDTDDSEGAILATSEEWRVLDADRVSTALAHQTGDILQVPAKFSAKKVAGERMYDVARRGGEVNLPPVAVTVSRLQMTRFELPELDIAVDCSSGTYIRAIARDVGAELGVGAHLVRLRRTRVGDFDVNDALSMESLADSAAVERTLVPPVAAVGHLARITLDDAEAAAVHHGGSIPDVDGGESGGLFALIDPAGQLLGIGERVGERIQPRKVFG